MFNLSETKMNHFWRLIWHDNSHYCLVPISQKYVKCCKFLIGYSLTHLLNFKDTTKFAKYDGTDLHTAYVETNKYHLFAQTSFQRKSLSNKDFRNS